ncbi:MAG: DNRLRE domain-containing protein [Actinomycetota bacterium]
MLLVPICLLVTLVPPALPPVHAAEPSPTGAQAAPPKSFPEGVELPEIADSPPKAYPVAPSTGSPPKVKRWVPNQELVEKRTATSKTFMGEKPGQLETRLYSDAVHFKDGAKWTEIDSGLSGRTGGRRTSKANSFELQFADRASDPALATLALDSSHSVSFGLQGAAPVEATRSNDSLTFAKVLPGTDLRLTSQPSGIKEDLILASPSSPDRFVFPLQLKGLTASINQAGDVVYQDSAGVERARTPHGFMFDSKIDPNSGEPAISFGVNYSLIPHGKGTALEVVLDRAWLDSPDRVWPLTVDPQVHAVRTLGDDTYVQYPYVNNYSTQTELKVGTPDGGASKARSYAHFDTGVLAGRHITSAVLYAAESWSWNCAAGPGPVHRVNQPWSGSTMTSFPGAPVDAAQATGAWYPGIGSCRDRLAYWIVTPQVATMAAAGESAGSFSFRAPSETDNNQWKKYKSYETGNGPYLSVEYASGDPFGSIDESTPVSGGIVVRGWVIDPDTAATTQVHIYVGSAGVALNANTYRPDVGSAYPGYGNYHGFDAVISAAPGTHNVCFYGINNAGPGTNPLLGPCRTITVPAATLPGAPPNPQATANPNGSIGASWGPSSTNPWSPVDMYIVYAYLADGTYTGQYKLVECTGACTSTSFAGLAAASHRFYIYAHNAGGWGSPAATNTVTPKTVPSAPANAAAAALGDGTVKVTWNLSASNGGAPVDFHNVHAYDKKADGSYAYSGRYRLPCGTCAEAVFDDLTAGTTYKFYVYAHNSVGYSPPSAATNPVVPEVKQQTHLTVIELSVPVVLDVITQLLSSLGLVPSSITEELPDGVGGYENEGRLPAVDAAKSYETLRQESGLEGEPMVTDLAVAGDVPAEVFSSLPVANVEVIDLAEVEETIEEDPVQVPNPTFMPQSGEIRTTDTYPLTETPLRTIRNSMIWSSQESIDGFGSDYAYEHDLKFLNNTNSSLVHPACPHGDLEKFWIIRGRPLSGVSWHSNMPKSSRPYLDTPALDPCTQQDFTVGVAFPSELSPNTEYRTVVTGIGTVESGTSVEGRRYELAAQKVKRASPCPSSWVGNSVKWCVGVTNNHPIVEPIIGDGLAPQCRTWAYGVDLPGGTQC